MPAVTSLASIAAIGTLLGAASIAASVSVGPSPGHSPGATLLDARMPSAPPQKTDHTAPVGTVVIGNGAANVNSSSVTLSLRASDDVGVQQMCLSNRGTCTDFIPYQSVVSWALPSGAGTKTVSVWFRDAAGNISAVARALVVLDTMAPQDGHVLATAGDGQVSLSWNGFKDLHSGITSYRVVFASKEAPVNCLKGTVASDGLSLATTVSGLTNGSAYGFRVCARDGAGNISGGVVATARPMRR